MVDGGLEVNLFFRSKITCTYNRTAVLVRVVYYSVTVLTLLLLVVLLLFVVYSVPPVLLPAVDLQQLLLSVCRYAMMCQYHSSTSCIMVYGREG